MQFASGVHTSYLHSGRILLIGGNMKISGIMFSLFFLLLNSNLFSQNTVLVDFGSSSENNSFELPGWNQLLKADELTYTTDGPGGLSFGADFEEFTDFMGVAGTDRQFSTSERIVVTWYNNSGEIIYFTSRISFTDRNNPSEDSPDGKWYTMRSFTDYRETFSEALPHSSVKTVFNITDTGVHKTDEIYSSVNINLAIEWGETSYKQYLICDKIELWNDADITPPPVPTDLVATPVSNSQIELNWNMPTDDLDPVEYLVYMNSEVEGYSKTNSYTCTLLESETEYTFSVTSLDMARNESEHSESVTAATLPLTNASLLINPIGINYLGAFVLPEIFAWGAEDMTYNENGDGGSADGYSGSLFVTDLNQAERGFVGEVSIPALVNSPTKNIDELNVATILQEPVNIRPANINSWDYVDIWRTGLEYIPNEGRLYSSWSIHYTVTGEKHSSISFCNAADLSGSNKYGAWYLGDPSSLPIDAMANDYLFSIPGTTINMPVPNHNLACGRFRDGGLSGLGPTIYSFESVGDNPPEPNSVLEISTMLEYGSVEGTDNYNYPNSIDGYKHSDDWKGAAFIYADQGEAVMLMGLKALGNNWYGYQGENMLNDWVYADLPYPSFDVTDPNGKGWKAHNYIPMALFYNFNDLLSVSAGYIESYEPQPYSVLRFNKELFFTEKCEIRSMDFDEANRRIYAAEFDETHDGRIIVHVWNVTPVVGTEKESAIPTEFRLEQNYPNPFNPSTRIKYSIPVVDANFTSTTHVTLRIYDVLGNEVATLVNEYQPAGNYSVLFNGSIFSSGLYFYTLKSGNRFETKKMLLLK